MILNIIGHMGFIVGAIFGVSLITALRRIFAIPFESHGWNILDWELATLQSPGGILMFLMAFSVTYGWNRYRRQRKFDENRLQQQ